MRNPPHPGTGQPRSSMRFVNVELRHPKGVRPWQFRTPHSGARAGSAHRRLGASAERAVPLKGRSAAAEIGIAGRPSYRPNHPEETAWISPS